MTWLQKGFNLLGGALGGAAMRSSGRLGMGLMAGARGAGAVAGANPAVARAITGGVAGGMYGAAADDTSMLGGAMMGAGLAAGGYWAGGRGKGMVGAYSALRSLGRGRGRALHSVFAAEAGAARSFIGRSYSRAVNRIDSTLKAGAGM